MEPGSCGCLCLGRLADPDCVLFRRTDRAIECIDLNGGLGLCDSKVRAVSLPPSSLLTLTMAVSPSALNP